jgi:hypothetical protein
MLQPQINPDDQKQLVPEKEKRPNRDGELSMERHAMAGILMQYRRCPCSFRRKMDF